MKLKHLHLRTADEYLAKYRKRKATVDRLAGLDLVDLTGKPLRQQYSQGVQNYLQRLMFLYSLDEMHEELTVKTKLALDDLFPALEYLLQEVGEEVTERNMAHDRLCYLVGKKGTGKTELVNWLIHSAYGRYGGDYIQLLEGKDLRALLAAFDEKLIHLVVIDDAMGALFREKGLAKVIGDFQQGRHFCRYRDAQNNIRGLVVFLIVTQSYFGIKKDFREEVDLAIFKSPPTNPSDLQNLISLVGLDATAFLEEIKQRIRRQFDDTAKGESIVWFGGTERGILKSKFPVPNYVVSHAQQVTSVSDSPTGGIPEWSPDAGFLDWMERFIRAHIVATNLKNAEPEECAQLYSYWLERDPDTGQRRKSFPQIKRELDLATSERQLSRRMVALEEFLAIPDIYRQVGELYEQFFVARAQANGYEATLGGGNTDLPDAIVDGQVYSLKCFHNSKERKRISVPITEIGQQELAWAREHGQPVKVVLLNPFWGGEVVVDRDPDKIATRSKIVFERRFMKTTAIPPPKKGARSKKRRKKGKQK